MARCKRPMASSGGVGRPAVLATAAVLALGCAMRSGGVVRIGVAGPFTDSVGAPMKRAAQLAAEEINAHGGIGGRRLQLVFRDDYGDADSAVAAATALYQSGVSAVVGHLYSGTTLNAAAVYNGGSDPVAEVSPSSSAPEVSQAGDYTFRICPSDLAHGAALARWAYAGLGLRRGTVLYANDEYGRGVRQTFVAEFTRLGGEVVNAAPYIGDQPVVGPFVARIAKNRQSQFLVVAGLREAAEEVLRQEQARGLTLPVLGADGLEGIEEVGALANGTYESLAYLPSIPTQLNRRFVAAYQRKFPGAAEPNQPAAAAYDAVYLLRDVIGTVGSSRRAVRDALAARDVQHPFDGVTGRIFFDSLGDAPGQQVHIAVVRGGALQLAEGK
jgi:branched-chain amino acid transport system substrate-binding protein